ncbi:MAG: S26 family signal peptidase [Phycisphaerales bacterium]|jgi:hypothetical protein
MQCPNCEFNNIPGQRTCARCTSVLDFGSIDVTPPRAGTTVIPLRFRSRLEIIASHIDYRLANASRRLGASVLNDVSVAPLLRSIVPGWAHRHRGQRRLGWFLTWVWLGLMLVAAALMGGPFGWTAYFAVVGWHGLAINLILNRRLIEMNVLARMGTGLFIWVCLNAFIYLPAGVMLQRLVTPFQADGILSGPLLVDGDLLLTTGPALRPTAYQRGDIVLYRVRGDSLRAGYTNINARDGFGVERIIGLPGDHIEVEGATIKVNGAPVSAADLPIRPGFRAFSCNLVLPKGCYFIVPSTLVMQVYHMDQAQTSELLSSASQVRSDDILGRVLIRWRPFRRMAVLGSTPSPVPTSAPSLEPTP